MNPFSAFTYIKRNMVRSICIVIMLACTCIVFMGGMYIDNINDTFVETYENQSRFAFVFLNGNNNDLKDELQRFYDEHEKYLPDSAKTFLYADIRSAQFKNIMSFCNDVAVPFFSSEEDFSKFIELTEALPTDLKIKENELILSEQLANNWGVGEGYVIEKDSDFPYIILPCDMTVKYILPLQGMQIYGWSGSFNSVDAMILPTDKNISPSLETDLNELNNIIGKDFPHITIRTGRSIIERTKDQMSFINYFFFIIIIVIALVFAITLNATFASMYDKRKYEFSIYKAIGFSKGNLFKKILSEMLTLDVAGLAAGSILCFIAIKVLNQILWEQGLHFVRPSVIGIIGTLVCNLAVIIPVLLANMKRLKKYDVTIY